MSANHNKLFWAIFMVFCVMASVSIYPQGAFENISLGGVLILAIPYALAGFFIRLFIKFNGAKIDKWL